MWQSQLPNRPVRRPEDSSNHRSRRAANRVGVPLVEPTSEHVATLRAYHWPGNIRELGAVMDRAAILGEGRHLEIEAALGFSGPPSSRAPSPFGGEEASAIDTLDQAMRRYIAKALKRASGRVEGRGGAAELLDINPHTLRARMRKLEVDWKAFRVAE